MGTMLMSLEVGIGVGAVFSGYQFRETSRLSHRCMPSQVALGCSVCGALDFPQARADPQARLFARRKAGLLK